ncbi:MAG: aldo/keto reductase [Phycisphaerales bacterium]|nr:MAG: aldo/keto reductase [Phycisphaerales bacterium]
MKRRSFLKVVGGVAGSCALGVGSGCKEFSVGKKKSAWRGMPRRTVGRTGEKVSIVGFPGLALTHYEQDRCTAGLHEAFAKGVNYFDVAPAYGNGDCEIKMGIGLQGIDRDKIFLACKTKMRDKEGARKELERSLKRLKTDHFDLYQMHHIRRPDEVEQALGPGGAIETFLEAKKEGKVKYFGFSAHTTKGALAAMNGYKFDTVMFPISFAEYYIMGFGKPVLELAKEQGMGVFGMKTLCAGAWPEGVERTRKWWYRPVEEQDEISMALRFTLSEDCVVAGIPPSFLDLTDRTIEAARAYSPITKTETHKLQEMAKTCKSLFKREEDRLASAVSPHEPVYADSPHECCPCAHA